MKPSQSYREHPITKPDVQSRQPHAVRKVDPSPLQKIIHAFHNCKSQFSQFISNHLAQNLASKRQSQDQNQHKNEQSSHQDHRFMKHLEEATLISEPKFHFNDQENQIIFQESLLLCTSMIGQFESNPNTKKSRTIKRLLTKSLFFLSKFIVENIGVSGKLRISWVLNQANYVLLQGGSSSQMPNQIGSKATKEAVKNCQFEVPLLITNIKIPFSFYFMFSALQQRYLKNESKSEKQVMKQLNYQVNNICEAILQNDQNNEARNLLIKTVCQSFGCFEFPITYIFLSSIVQILQSQMEQKYRTLNTESLHPLRLNRELFSLKNIGLIFEALIKHEKNSFKKIQIYLIEQNQNDNLKYDCSQCSASLDVMILVQLDKGQLIKQVARSAKKGQIRAILCPYCFTEEEKLDLNKLQSSNFQNEKIRFLMRLMNKSFWRQKFQLHSLQDFKKINTNMLILTEKCNKNYLQDAVDQKVENKQISILSEIQIVYLCLKTLFMNENSGKSLQPTKSRSVISLKSLKQNIIGLYLIVLNAKSQAIRLETIEALSSEYFLSHLSQIFEDSEILDIIQIASQDEKNRVYENDHRHTVKRKVGQLLLQIKNRLFDNCTIIQTKSMKFLLQLRSFYPSSRLRLQIFQFITQILEQKMIANRLKELPMEVIQMLFKQIENECESNNQNRVATIVTGKHLINKFLKMSFTFFDFQVQSSGTQFRGDHIWQLVMIVRKFLEKILQLVDEQEKQIKTNSKKLQYENFVICYLKEFRFTKTTINCFVFNDLLLQKLISLTQWDQDEDRDKDVEIDKKQSRLLENLKLILEELFEFSKEILKNPVIVQSMQKKSKKIEKNSKSMIKGHNVDIKQKGFNLANLESNFQFKSPSCNLNKIIKNIIRKERKLNLLDCEILFLLIQKNILLNYETENNITDTPSKIKRLILSLETTTKFNEILNFIEKEIKECNMESLQVLIKLYVVICIQINQERKIQNLFVFYKNAYKFFKKTWLHDYRQKEARQGQTKNDHFFIRTLKTIGFLATQFEKFKKIQCITQTHLSVERPNIKDYSIFSLQTQQAINALETFPQSCFVELYQEIYDLFDMFLSEEQSIPKSYGQFIKICLDILTTITSIHPHLLVKINKLMKSLPIIMQLDPHCQSCYLAIFENILTTKDSLLIGIITRSYDNIGHEILQQNENQSKEKYQNLEKFYKVTFSLLKQDVLSIRQVQKTVFYGLFTKNIKINNWTKDYLEYINQKGEDLNLFNDFKRSIEWIALKLKSIDSYFSEDQQFFRNVTNLTQINKQKHKKVKVLLQKDLRQINIRSTFIKKTAEILQGDFDWLKYTNDQKDCCIILLLKIIGEQTELDVYQLQRMITAMEKVIKEYHLTILRTRDRYPQLSKKQIQEKETDTIDMSPAQNFEKEDGNIWMIGQKRRMIFLVGQMMYTLIKLINEKKLKMVVKDLEKMIESKKFNSNSISLPVNSLPNEKPGQSTTHQVILNYEDCLTYIRQLDILLLDTSQNNSDETITNIMNLTKQFKEVALRMYSILFEDEKSRVIKVVQPEIKKGNAKKKKKKNSQSNSDDDQAYTSEFSPSKYQNSEQSSIRSINSHSRTKGIKKHGVSSSSLSKSNENPTKKANVQKRSLKPHGQSLPKRLQKRLATIGEMTNEQQHVIWGQGGRRSKRLMEKEEKKRVTSQKIKQV